MIPEVPFHFIDLELALAHLEHAREVAAARPSMRPYADSSIPIFWDGDRRWLCVDVASEAGPVLLAEHADDMPYRPLYAGLIEFVDDAVRAMGNDRPPEGLRKDSRRRRGQS